MTFPLRSLASLLSLLLAAPVAHAADLAELGESAKVAFQPLGEAELAAARSELGEKAVTVERLLPPTTEFGSRWLEYLAWEGVTKQLDPAAQPDLAAARETLRRLGSGADGLERSQLQAIAAELEDFLGVAQFARVDAERQRRAFDQAVDGLLDGLADDERLGSARGSFAIETALDRIAGVTGPGPGDELVHRVRDENGQPNFFVEVEQPLLDRFVARPVNDCSPVTDCILGTRINGTGSTNATLSVTTLPSRGRARLLFRLTGSTRSQTVGVNGPVRINSLGDTHFTASKLVVLSDDSFSTSPATASATTTSQTQSVKKIGGGIGSRLIERIARQRVAQQKSRADAIAADHAEDRIAAGLNDRLAGEIARARRRYQESFTLPLERRRAKPRSLVQHTTSTSLVIEAIQAGDTQLAAPGPAPEGVAAPLSARLHQTAVNNLLDALLGGATIKRTAVDQPPRINVITPDWLKLRAEQPAEGEEFKPWSITLRDPRPVSVEFREGSLTALIHTAAIEADGKSYNGWDLIATYQPEQVDGAWRLVRQGDIEVLPSRFDPAVGGRMSSSEVGLRNNLAKILNEGDGRLPASIDIDAIDLSKRPGPVKALALEGLQFLEGWVAAGWRAL